jgi:hypothetical protein
MLRSLSFRLLSAAALVSFVYSLAVLAPFLSAASDAGAGLSTREPTILVNRRLKGDLLPVTHSHSNPAVSPRELGSKPTPQRSGAQIPLGCDPAFSPIFSLHQGNIYRRCTV